MNAVKLALFGANSLAGDLDTKMLPTLTPVPSCDARTDLAEPLRTWVRHDGVLDSAREAQSAWAAFGGWVDLDAVIDRLKMVLAVELGAARRGRVVGDDALGNPEATGKLCRSGER